MPSFVIHLIVLLFVVFPSVTSFPIDPETTVDPVIDYFTVEGLYLSVELPSKQNPLDHSYIARSFSLMLALEFATVVR